MTHYLALGAGRQGTAAVYDLIVHGGATALTWVDADEAQLQAGIERIEQLTSFPSIRGHALDASETPALTPLFEEADICFNALPYRFSMAMTQLALDASTHILDLGGNTAIVQQQLELHREHAHAAEVNVLPDCGLMPGLGNLLIALAVEELGECESVEVRCGGLPQNPKPPLDYMLLFSVGGLTNEYFGKAQVLRDGHLIEIDTFTELETFDVDNVGEVEAFITSGGLSTTPETFAGSISNLNYKTIRYPGHYEKFKVLLDLGLLGEEPVRVKESGGVSVVPRHLLHTMLERHLTFEGDQDLSIMTMRAKARHGNKALTASLLDYHDEETGFSSMERTTAFSATACAAMIARGDVTPGPGPLEKVIPARPFLDELALRGVQVRVVGEGTL